MRNTIFKLFAGLFAGALLAFAMTAGTALASAGSEDSWAPPKWAAASKSTTFTSSLVTVTCTNDTAGGNSIGSGPDAGALAMSAPKFSGCTDSLGGTDTVTTKATGWTVSFVSDSADAGCPAGTGNDEAGGSDCVVIGVPQNAATIVLGSVGCSLTIQPGGATTVGATMADAGGKTKDSFTLNSQPLTFSGCGTSGSATFSGTYTLSSPNGGVLIDNS